MVTTLPSQPDSTPLTNSSYRKRFQNPRRARRLKDPHPGRLQERKLHSPPFRYHKEGMLTRIRSILPEKLLCRWSWVARQLRYVWLHLWHFAFCVPLLLCLGHFCWWPDVRSTVTSAPLLQDKSSVCKRCHRHIMALQATEGVAHLKVKHRGLFSRS